MVLLCVVGSEEEGENQFDVDGDGTRKNNLNETVVVVVSLVGERKGKSVCVTYIRILYVWYGRTCSKILRLGTNNHK